VEDQPLYHNGRAGKDFSYSIPVPTGLYTVRLKFAEPKCPWMFERPFNVSINGQDVLTDFDIVQAAKGPRRAIERSFRNVVPNADGTIALHFTAGKSPLGQSGDALVQAIEVLPSRNRPFGSMPASEAEFVDWNSCVWTADAHFSGGTILKSAAPVVSCVAHAVRSGIVPHGPLGEKHSATRLPCRRACTRCI